jgi:hypothetical protein
MKKTYLAGSLILLLSPTLNAQTCKPDSIPATTPSSRFTISTNSTVTDKQTGLMWKQCSEGQSGTGCAIGGASSYNWQSALQQSQTVNNTGFAGYKDWRLPNVKELRSIVERQCYEPAINAAVFPNTPSSFYWSSSPVDGGASSPVANFGGYAWIVYFYYGTGNWYNMDIKHSVRLVRGGQ